MGSKLKARILDAAAECFAEHGFAGTSTKTIALRAGVNETSLFRLFGTKRKLFDASFTLGTSPFTDLLDPLDTDPNFRRAIHTFAQSYCRLLTRRLICIEYIAFLEFTELIRKEAFPWMTRYLAIMKRRVTIERRAGRAHRRVNTDSAALALNNILYHYMVQVHSYRYPNRLPFGPPRKVTRRLVDAWLLGVLKSK